MSTVAARVGAALRSAMKDRPLTGRELAAGVARLTGRPQREWNVSNRLTGRRPLVTVSDDLFAYAKVLDVDPVQLVADAMREHLACKDGRDDRA